MADFSLLSDAERDIETILAWSRDHFGSQGKRRYGALLTQAIHDIAIDPDRLGSYRRPQIHPDARTYHLFHSRNRVAKEIGRVKQPRHFLLYRLREGKKVEVGRVLHDRMELVLHLPETFLRED